MKEKTQIIILAAGQGKRMGNATLPKVLTLFKGKPFINHLLESIKDSGVCDKPAIVIGQKADQIKEALGSDYIYIHQSEQLGTGHAVMVTKDKLEGQTENVMVLYGDHPLVSAETIKNIVEAHATSKAVMTMATTTVSDFNDWRQSFIGFGRIVRDQNNKLEKIVEKKDATPEELEIKEVNPSYFCFKTGWLWQNLDKLKNNNAQAEYYLTDLVGLAVEQGQQITTVEIGLKEALGVNTSEQLELLEKLTTISS